MKARQWIVLGIAAAIAVFPAGAAERPNIVLILVDDLGFSDLGCHGGEIPTPNLDKLAAEGIRFRQFYNESKCSQSRASILSGLRWHQVSTQVNQAQTLVTDNFTTLPRVLGAAGYRTGNFGKWHVSKDPGAHGFDTWVERPKGGGHFNDAVEVDGKTVRLGSLRFGPDIYTDYAMEFIDASAAQGKPFFAFMAYYAPHFPLQAPEELVQPHLDVYKMGWDAMREARYRRQLDLGVVPPHWKLSPRDEVVPAWESLSPERQADEARLMAVHAAMVQRLDWNIGRLMQRLAEKGLADNTLVFFCSDNGASPWVFNKEPILPAGSPESYRSLDSKWANACNTPFRYHKQWAHEGGIHTPGIAYWPAGIKQPGRASDFTGHIIDLMPTLVEVCGAPYPKAVLPMEGESLAAAFADPAARRTRPLAWEFFGGRALRDGKWKLVGQRSGEMELYDMEADGTELNDLRFQYPERYEQMKKDYDAWAERTGAKTDRQCASMGSTNQKRLYPEQAAAERRAKTKKAKQK